MILDEIINDYNKIFAKRNLSDASFPIFTHDEVKELCQLSINTFASQKTVLKINKSVVIIGDLHGSLDDLMRIINNFGKPPETNYLFLGDYVDRGNYSVPVIEYLLAIACKYPDNVWLIRGNHEFSHINKVYGFYEEILDIGGTNLMWEYFQEVFYYLPLAAIVFDKIFCVHGGLSPSLSDMSLLEGLPRPIPNYINMPLISDLVWSDPTDATDGYGTNQRGSGVLFGQSVVENFLNENNMQLVVRGHQCTANGVHAFANSMGVTVFSCSDYSAFEKNKCGAFVVNSLEDIVIYSLTKTDDGFSKESIKMHVKNGKPGIELKRNKKRPKALQKAKLTVPKTEDNEGLHPVVTYHVGKTYIKNDKPLTKPTPAKIELASMRGQSYSIFDLKPLQQSKEYSPSLDYSQKPVPFNCKQLRKKSKSVEFKSAKFSKYLPKETF